MTQQHEAPTYTPANQLPEKRAVDLRAYCPGQRVACLNGQAATVGDLNYAAAQLYKQAGGRLAGITIHALPVRYLKAWPALRYAATFNDAGNVAGWSAACSPDA